MGFGFVLMVAVWDASENIHNSLTGAFELLTTAFWSASSRFCFPIDLGGNAKPIWRKQKPVDIGPQPACDRRRTQGYVPTSVNLSFLPCTLVGLQDHTQLQTAVSPTSLALVPCFPPYLINLLERHRVMGYQNEGQSPKPSQSSVGIAPPWGSWRKWHRKESVLGYDVILAKAKREEDIIRFVQS